MRLRLRAFIEDTDGAITVEWIVLVGFLVSLTLSVITALSPGLTGKGKNIVTPDGISANF